MSESEGLRLPNLIKALSPRGKSGSAASADALGVSQHIFAYF
jgi:hypothetical protein